MKHLTWKKYALEFLSIFIAVVSAFALNNWNENRKNENAKNKILIEILNGLEEDKKDVDLNVYGHKWGTKSCNFWKNLILDKEQNVDTLVNYYIALTRDFTSIQNTSGFETLKSKGFEIIDNDSLRSQIIALYEYDYQTLQKLEEEYYELQFQKNYFKDFNTLIAPHLQFDSTGNINGISLPLNLTPASKNILLTYLFKIQFNRDFLISYYDQVKTKIDELQEQIERELNP